MDLSGKVCKDELGGVKGEENGVDWEKQREEKLQLVYIVKKNIFNKMGRRLEILQENYYVETTQFNILMSEG